MAVLYENKGRNKWDLVGTTEVIDKSLNPEWKKSFDVPYKFEVQQLFKIDVYHVYDHKRLSNLEVHDKISEI
jgi:hypothetical protein